MRSTVKESILFLRTALRIDRLKPLAGTPSEGAAAVKLPPGEPVPGFGSPNDLEDVAILRLFNGGVAETWPGPHAQPGTLGVQHSDTAAYGDFEDGGGGDSGRLHGRQQGRIVPPGVKVLASEVSKLHGHAGRGIGMPFQARVTEILGDDAGLHKHFANGRADHGRPTVFLVEGEEAEADVVSRLCEVAAEAVSDHGVGHRRYPGSLLSHEFAQWAKYGLARALILLHTFQTSALEVLDKLSVLFKGLGDGEAEDLRTALRHKGGQEGFINVVPRLGEVRGRLFLCPTWPESDQDHGQSQAPDDEDCGLLRHKFLGRSDFLDAIIA